MKLDHKTYKTTNFIWAECLKYAWREVKATQVELTINLANDDIVYSKALGGCDASLINSLINRYFDKVGLEERVYTASELYKVIGTYSSSSIYDRYNLETLRCYVK